VNHAELSPEGGAACGARVSAAKRRGFSLVEMILSLAIVAILLGSMGSLVVVAAKAMPGRAGAAELATAGAAFLEQMTSDLSCAEVISAAGDTGIDFEVGDRDGDGKRESIRYEWGGAGSVPIRVYNGETAAMEVPPLITDSFVLGYEIVTEEENLAAVETSNPEMSVGGWSGLLTLASRAVDSSKPVAQHFVPTLAAGTRTWTITRVSFNSSRDLSPTGTTAVELRMVGADGLPDGGILASTTVAESSLSALGGTTTVSFTGVPPLTPGVEVAIVFTCTDKCPSMNVSYASLLGPRAVPMSTYNGSWASSTMTVIPHEVYATTTSIASTRNVTKKLQRVNISMGIVGLLTPIRGTVAIRNTPEVQ